MTATAAMTSTSTSTSSSAVGITSLHKCYSPVEDSTVSNQSNKLNYQYVTTMSQRVGTPINQVRLTNVAYVRLNKGGKRFEIACYRNKVLNWRNKIETDIGEVLQIDNVFTNVSKGLLANSKDLVEIFGTSDSKTVCKEILDKGELQVSEQERLALYDSIFRDIASIVADKAINPDNGRPYTTSMIQNAMKQIHYSVNASKNAKSQALDVIKKLKDVMPIGKASMHLRIVLPLEYKDMLMAVMTDELNVAIESEGIEAGGTNAVWSIKVDPDLFRKVEEVVQLHSKNSGRVEVVAMRVLSVSSSSSATTTSNKDAAAAAATTSSDTGSHNDVTDGDNHAAIKKSSKKSKSSSSALVAAMADGLKIDDGNGGSISVADDDEGYNNDYDGMEESMKAFGMVQKKKKDKKKSTKQLEDSDDDNSDDNSDGDINVLASIGAAGKSNQSSSTNNKLQLGNKKGKKTKRLEKEELVQKADRAKKLQDRLDLEHARLRDAGSTSATVFTALPGIADVCSGTGDSTTAATTASTTGVTDAALNATTAASQKCNTCGGSFADALSYRSHFKSEWHRFNLNRKMKLLPIIDSEAEFTRRSMNGEV